MFWKTAQSSNKAFRDKKIWVCFCLIVIVLFSGWGCSKLDKDEGKSLKVGVLYSLTGPMAPYEKSVMEATLLAINEINDKGGVLGKSIEVVLKDGASDPEVFTSQAESLVQKEGVSVIMGCANSYNRRQVSSIIEKHKNMLICPAPNEGIELSPNVVYTGSAPNQLIVPGVSWAYKYLGKKFYLVGSDEVFSRVSNVILKDYIYALGGEVVGESYIPLNNKSQMSGVIESIELSQPEVIVNTLGGDSSADFYRALRRAGIYSEDIPVMNFSFSEGLFKELGVGVLEGDYNVGAYFQGIKSLENEKFVESFQRQYGKGRLTDDLMDAAYLGVYLWADAVNSVGVSKSESVLAGIKAKSYIGPSGLTYISPATNMAYKQVRVGQITPEGQYNIVWDSKVSIFPVEYTIFKSQQVWDEFLQDLYQKWGHKWYRRSK